MRAIGEEYHTLQGVVAEIVADMVDWVDVMGQGSAVKSIAVRAKNRSKRFMGMILCKNTN